MLESIVISCIVHYSSLYGLDPALLKAMAYVESTNNPSAISPNRRDYGLLQVRAEYVPESPQELLDPCTNVKVATRLIDAKKRQCVHQEGYTWLVCYNAGITGGARITNPKQFPYYLKVMSQLTKIKN